MLFQDLPFDVALRIIGHFSIQDVINFLKAAPEWQQHTIFLTDSWNYHQPQFFPELPYVMTKRLYRCYLPYWEKGLYDPLVHRMPIKLIEITDGEHVKHALELSLDYEPYTGKSLVHSLGDEEDGPIVLDLGPTSFVFFNITLKARTNYINYWLYRFEQRFDELTQCHIHFGLPKVYPRIQGPCPCLRAPLSLSLTSQEQLDDSRLLDLSGLRCLNLSGVISVSDFCLPSVETLAVLFEPGLEAHRRPQLMSLELPSITSFTINFQDTLPKMKDIKITRREDEFTLFELTKTGHTLVTPSELIDTDISFINNFFLVHLQNIPTWIFHQAQDVSQIHTLKLTLGQPECTENIYNLARLKALHIQVDVADVVLPAFITPELDTLSIVVLQDTPGIIRYFECHSHLTPVEVYLYRSLCLLDHQPECTGFRLDPVHWTRLMSKALYLHLLGFEMPFLFEKDSSNIHDPEAIWIWTASDRLSVTLRPVVRRSQLSREPSRLTLNLTLPHRTSTLWGLDVLYRAKVVFNPVLHGDVPTDQTLKLCVTVPDCMFPNHLRMQFGNQFDVYEVNGYESAVLCSEPLYRKHPPCTLGLVDFMSMEKYALNMNSPAHYDMIIWSFRHLRRSVRQDLMDELGYNTYMINRHLRGEIVLPPFKWNDRPHIFPEENDPWPVWISNSPKRGILSLGKLGRSNKRKFYWPEKRFWDPKREFRFQDML